MSEKENKHNSELSMDELDAVAGGAGFDYQPLPQIVIPPPPHQDEGNITLAPLKK